MSHFTYYGVSRKLLKELKKMEPNLKEDQEQSASPFLPLWPATSCFVSCYSSKIKQNWPLGLILSILLSCVNPQPWGTVLDRSLIHSSCQVAQSCPTLCNPMDYTPHAILQARTLEWAALPFSRASSQPRDGAQVSHIAGGFFTSWATREAHMNVPNFRKEIVLLNIKNKS